MKKLVNLFWRKFGAIILFASVALTVHAQGTFGPVIVVRTGGGQPIVTGSQSVFIPTGTVSPTLQFAFGFSTDEEVVPSVFLDAATITLQNDAGSLTAVFATVDRTGTYWAPIVPGGGVLDPNAILRDPFPFPDVTPDHANKTAWLVTVPVPGAMLGQPLTMYLDLFDNQNPLGSLAWISHIAVPEPSTALMVFIGLLVAYGFTWRNGRS